jgi:phosphatidylethanolamine-binding protein (PEBP) family uncharacterized protein
MRLWGYLAIAGLCAAMPAAAQSKFAANVRWCSASPEFKLSGVPKGTASLDLQMVDLNVPTYRHGGGQVAFRAGQKSVSCGALAAGGYNGPSPPAGQVHAYQWTIRALDAGGQVLGQAVTQRSYPE